MKAVEDPDAEVARLTRLIEDTRHELNAIREARRQENLRVIDLALELAESKDPGYWSIADLIRAALDQPRHPDDVNGCPCGGECGCEK